MIKDYNNDAIVQDEMNQLANGEKECDVHQKKVANYEKNDEEDNEIRITESLKEVPKNKNMDAIIGGNLESEKEHLQFENPSNQNGEISEEEQWEECDNDKNQDIANYLEDKHQPKDIILDNIH